MPELPEVETTVRQLSRELVSATITGVDILESASERIERDNLKSAVGRQICAVTRRGRCILVETDAGHMIIHLQMSGTLRIQKPDAQRLTHVLVEFLTDRGGELRKLVYRLPRKLGYIVWTEDDPLQHEKLNGFGKEPLDEEFTGEYLFERAQKKRSCSIKNMIMDNKMVAGVGNIYATEALFRAGIHPDRSANELSKDECHTLVDKIRCTLHKAIERGGTTLDDGSYISPKGEYGTFGEELRVYGLEGAQCMNCKEPIQKNAGNGRSSYFCGICQPLPDSE